MTNLAIRKIEISALELAINAIEHSINYECGYTLNQTTWEYEPNEERTQEQISIEHIYREVIKKIEKLA